MVTISPETLRAYRQIYNGSEPHDPRNNYDANTHVKDAEGNIYVSLQAVPGSNDADDQILISDTDYWYHAVGTLGSTIDLDAILSPNGVGNGSIIAFNGTSGNLEAFTLPTSHEYYVNADGDRSSRQVTPTDPNYIGFGQIPKQSTFNKTSYVAYETSTTLTTGPIAHNTTMDLAVDRQGFLVSAYGIPDEPANSAAVLLSNPAYYRMTMAGNFEQCVRNRNARVSRISSFAGRYCMMLDNGSFYSRITRQQYVHNMYSTSWLGQDDMDLDTVFGGTDYTVLDFEQSANCYLVLYQNTTDNSYRLVSFRFQVDGQTVTTLREVILAGTNRPTQFGFIEYPQVPTETLDPRIFAVQDDMLVYTTAGNTLTTAVACNRVYPFTHEKFYISAGTSATFLTTFENDTYSSTDTGIGIPNATTSFRDDTENGFVAVFDETVYVEGSNPDGELGTGDSTTTTGTTVTIYSTTQPAERQLKDCMICHLGSCRAFVIWSDQEAFMSGLGRGARSQLGRFMASEEDDGYGSTYTFQSNVFRRVFNTNDSITDMYVHNHSQTRPLEPILVFLLNNGTAYGKGTILVVGNLTYDTTPYLGILDVRDPRRYWISNRTIDYLNISYRRLAI